jgi:hypothetical protein
MRQLFRRQPVQAQIMKYMLLAHRDEKRWKSMSDGERTAFEAACQASEQDLAHSLHLLDVWHLQEDGALLISVVDGHLSLTDGPAAASQGQLIQFLLIQARDLNTAIQIASKMPQAQAGAIEVRPLVE